MATRFYIRQILAVALIICWLSHGAHAANLAGMSLPDTYSVNGQSLVLNGLGLRTLTILSIRAYIAGLYLPQPSHDATQILASGEPRVLILRFLRSASKARIEAEYRAGERENCGQGGCAASDKADFERLIAVAPAVERGDTSTYVFTTSGVRVFANQRLIGDFANKDLAYHLLAGFIGPHPPSQQLRRRLLGLPGN
ncbi:chalcone isomerase family protein [Rhodopila sp.]|uniref:chalcone isomerase family protein n=1 Tax=Rhodopila sp. TaxID=2480087 RepID=UPI003D107687